MRRIKDVVAFFGEVRYLSTSLKLMIAFMVLMVILSFASAAYHTWG